MNEKESTMSVTSLKSMLEAKGTFPDEEDVLASFENLFAFAEQGKETPDDLAWAFLEGLDQLSNVNPELEPALGQRLYNWAIANWATEPPRFCERLCAILVNVGTPESLQFMKDQRERSNAEAVKAILTEYIQDHPISRAEAEAAKAKVEAASVAEKKQG
jgi:hypothetical protein